MTSHGSQSGKENEPTASAGCHRLELARRRILSRWLLAVAWMVFAMVVVGGITRLTGSGLSITEWKPVTGVLPPLTEAGWQAEFAKYQRIPQYQVINGPGGMTLADFRFIYFWEWAHRLLGRLVGLVYALPLLWFWRKGWIPPGFKSPLFCWLGLGAAQGVAGWWMVASGLSGRTEVSHYRLAVHLLLALAILGGLLWTALDLRKEEPRPSRPRSVFSLAVLAVLFVALLLGALTAGLKAGHVSQTWPLMYGKMVPPGLPWELRTLPDHPVWIHFLHRWWVWLLVGMLVVLARKIRRQSRLASVVLHSAFGTQIVLGIATVITGVPPVLGVLHQAVGALVVASSIWCLHLLENRDLHAGKSKQVEIEINAPTLRLTANRTMNQNPPPTPDVMSEKPDIFGRPEIERLVNAFYTKVRADEPLGHVFDGVARVNWETHLPKLYDFWDTVLFRAGTFRGNPIDAHAKLLDRVNLDWPMFERWLALFRETVDELFAGEKAGHIIRCAEDMARVIHARIHQIPNPRFDPANLTPEQKARYAGYRGESK